MREYAIGFGTERNEHNENCRKICGLGQPRTVHTHNAIRKMHTVYSYPLIRWTPQKQ